MSIQGRIQEIVEGLLPNTPFQNKYGKRSALEERMHHYKTPGVSIAVVNNGRIEWAQGFGVKEWGKDENVTDETVFQAGSISKPTFALAVMKLVEEGLLDLDCDVNEYLTSWKVPPNGDWQPNITLRQLLSHTAGLTIHGFPGYTNEDELPTLVQILNGEQPANTSAVVVNTLPGTQFRYSGGGTTIAQLVVQDVLKREFPDIMKDVLLDPLHMTHSTFEQKLPKHIESKRATAHPNNYRPVEGKAHIYPEMAAAGLWTTATDLATMGIEIQKACKGESRYLSQPTVEQMLSPQVEEHMSIGFFLEGKGEDVRFSHGGWDEGFVAKMTMYKHHGKGAVIMLNSNQGNEMLGEFERAIAKAYDWPSYFTKNEEVTLSKEVLRRYVGVYSKEGMRIEVSEKAGKLLLQLNEQHPVTLEATSESTFKVQELNTEVTFETGAEGKITTLNVVQNGKTIVTTLCNH